MFDDILILLESFFFSISPVWNLWNIFIITVKKFFLCFGDQNFDLVEMDQLCGSSSDKQSRLIKEQGKALVRKFVDLLRVTSFISSIS